MRLQLVIPILALIDVQCQAAKILAFFPMPVKSHHSVFIPVLTELAKRGHKVDYYSPFTTSEHNGNLTLFKTKDFMTDILATFGKDSFREYAHTTTWTKMIQAHMTYGIMIERVCKDPEIVKLIKSTQKYDLIIHGGLFYQDYANTLAHKFNVPSVNMVPAGEWSTGNELAGLPDNPSYMIDYKMSYNERMTFLEKLHNIYVTTMTVLTYYYSMYTYQDEVDKCFQYPGWESRPSLSKLASDNALILSNSHHSLGFPYPRAPHFKDIGGVNILPNKPLPKGIETFMNEAKHGVIYFSLGSVTDMSTMIDPRFKDIFAKTFARLKERVLWKWNGERWDVPKNVMLQKWFPQQDILAHKNIKLFISHGGLLSSFETVYFGVPVLDIPLFADQPKNAKRVAHFGFGEYLSWNEVTEEALYNKIRTLIDDPKFKQEATRRSALMKDRPMKPLDEAIYWIEYVLKHGRVLQPAAVHLSFVQLHLLDVYGFLFGILIAMYCVSRFIFRTAISCFFRRNNPKVAPLSNKKRQ